MFAARTMYFFFFFHAGKNNTNPFTVREGRLTIFFWFALIFTKGIKLVSVYTLLFQKVIEFFEQKMCENVYNVKMYTM